MKVTEFSTVDGKTIVVTDPQEMALEHAGRLTRTGYRRVRQFDGEPTHSDTVIRGLLHDYDGMTTIAPTRDAGAYVVTDPINPTLEEQRDTFDLAVKCAKYRFGCNVVTMLAKHASDRRDELCRMAREIRVALLVIDWTGGDR